MDKILEGESFYLTGYKTLKERKSIIDAITNMGGSCLDVVRQFDDAIFITEKADGEKFNSAYRWGKTVLKKEWIFQCLNQGKRVEEKEFIVGDTQTSRKNVRRRLTYGTSVDIEEKEIDYDRLFEYIKQFPPEVEESLKCKFKGLQLANKLYKNLGFDED